MDKALSKRVITAILGIAAILALIILGGRWGMTVLALVGCFGALFEYFVMLFIDPQKNLQKVVGIGFGFFLAVLIIFRASFLYEGISLFFILFFIFYTFLAHQQQGNISTLISDLTFSMMGIFYISFLFSFWPKVRELDQGVLWIFLVFLIPWLSDSTGFLVGRKWGKHKLSPVISPHKTVEGALSAIIVSVIGVYFYKTIVFDALSIWDALWLGSIGAVLSQLGDLFESLIKRSLDVKDSGIIIPGHGGVLDRFDSVLFCGPFIYFYAIVT